MTQNENEKVETQETENVQGNEEHIKENDDSTGESYEAYKESKPSIFQKIKGLFSNNLKGANPVKHPKTLLSFFGLILVLQFGYGLYVSQNPNEIDVIQNAQAEYELTGFTDPMPKGFTSTSTLIKVAQTLVEKPGGYVTNDIFPLSLMLDNMPNWEFGALVQVRDFSSVMRQDFSRSQNNSIEDPNLSLAEPSFNQDSDKWIFPATEKVIKEGVSYTQNYQLNLADPQSNVVHFYARSDNLVVWLKKVESRLGSYSQRLSAAVEQPGTANQTDELNTPKLTSSWHEIDDVFYEARGATWAILHMLKAVQVDFEDVLVDKNAEYILEQIIFELEATQQTVWSPIILNGDGFGLVANHSLVLANYISRANSALAQLQKLLENG